MEQPGTLLTGICIGGVLVSTVLFGGGAILIDMTARTKCELVMGVLRATNDAQAIEHLKTSGVCK